MTLRPYLTASLLALLLASAAAPAQQNPPSATEAPAVEDLPTADPGKDVVVEVPRGAGTDIVGERESPIGLFITPWKETGAERALERPARLLQEELLPINEDVFIRNLEYYEALSGALKSRNAVTPVVPALPAGGATPPPAPAPATVQPQSTR